MALKPLNQENIILAKIAQGDHHAFFLLFDHYQRYVYGFGRKLTRSDDQAEEIVQDIFQKIWTLKEKLPEIEHFEAYITRLVRNQAYTILRKNMLSAKINTGLSEEAAMEVSDLNTELDYRETVVLLNEAIQSLPDQQRKAYELCHQQGLKYEDAAKEMNISPDTVHYHMKLALKTIREHFKRSSFLYPALISFLFK
ncbi:RNA polymerase ECF-type sigma factor [Pedobacter sp. BAL39]|uniref:RNA polymerase sigma factor n=1 Tax=Pedobacter sp. BAL39 TaxID=391596 RepID=UPI000155AD96|nr:RNA polymerase sigma-70 factor [Pedobacter sp. BAL39]EDM33862.1 RNA polymerase ECF-type sigma factor [Pedobacter sp. BAL39]